MMQDSVFLDVTLVSTSKQIDVSKNYSAFILLLDPEYEGTVILWHMPVMSIN